MPVKVFTSSHVADLEGAINAWAKKEGVQLKSASLSSYPDLSVSNPIEGVSRPIVHSALVVYLEGSSGGEG